MPGTLIYGKRLLVFVNNQAIGCTTDCQLQSTKAVIPAACKDLDGARQILASSQEWSISGSGLWDYASTLGPDGLYPFHKNGTRLAVRMSVVDSDGDETSNRKYYQGYALLTQWQLGGPLDGAATYAFTFEGDGDLEQGTAT